MRYASALELSSIADACKCGAVHRRRRIDISR
jgi:hypothetical protein